MSWNPYIYVRDNAVNRIDPEGLEDLGGEAESLEEAETTVQESTNSLKTLMEYRLPLLKQGGYEINTEVLKVVLTTFWMIS